MKDFAIVSMVLAATGYTNVLDSVSTAKASRYLRRRKGRLPVPSVGGCERYYTRHCFTDKEELKKAIIFHRDTASFHDKSLGRVSDCMLGPINEWCVSQITDFSYLFENYETLNEPLDQWNMEAALTTEGMFLGATSFNQDLSGWNLSKVQNMDLTFSHASSFNQNLCMWNVSIANYSVRASSTFTGTACPETGDPLMGYLNFSWCRACDTAGSGDDGSHSPEFVGSYSPIFEIEDNMDVQKAAIACMNALISEQPPYTFIESLPSELSQGNIITVRAFQQVLHGLNYRLVLAVIKPEEGNCLGAFAVTVSHSFQDDMHVTEFGKQLDCAAVLPALNVDDKFMDGNAPYFYG